MAASNPERDQSGRRLASVTRTMVYADCSRNTLYRRIADGSITAYQAGRILRIDLDSVDAWLRPVNEGRA
ncbi:MAG: putative phage excisionase [Marmoricola sp.]|nr:putative phage excisionase [Marmoricola sp.]